ncbi:hypothetical protein ACXGR5_08315, partial [Levilactobacillus spicheri]
MTRDWLVAFELVSLVKWSYLMERDTSRHEFNHQSMAVIHPNGENDRGCERNRGDLMVVVKLMLPGV